MYIQTKWEVGAYSDITLVDSVTECAYIGFSWSQV